MSVRLSRYEVSSVPTGTLNSLCDRRLAALPIVLLQLCERGDTVSWLWLPIILWMGCNDREAKMSDAAA